jgi:hypothetical protein
MAGFVPQLLKALQLSLSRLGLRCHGASVTRSGPGSSLRRPGPIPRL